MRFMRMCSIGLLCIAMIAVGCSSNDTVEENANYVSIDPTVQPVDVDVSAPRADSAAAAPDAAAVDEFDTIVDVFDSFLSLRARAITGDLATEELHAVATPQAIEQVRQLRSTNDDLIARDSYAALSNLAEWSNVTSVVESDDRYLFTDCTERQYVTPGGATVVHFVTNDVTMTRADDSFLVEAVVETQDGRVALGPDEFGCVPPSFVERAEQTATTALNEASRLIADPAAALATELSPVFAGQARTDLERVLETLNIDGLSRTSDERIELNVVGMDVSRPEFTVVVAVCRTYPQGRTLVTSDGDQTTTDIPLGSSLEEWLYVQLEPVPSGSASVDTVTAVEDRGPNCERG